MWDVESFSGERTEIWDRRRVQCGEIEKGFFEQTVRNIDHAAHNSRNRRQWLNVASFDSSSRGDLSAEVAFL